MMWVKRIARTLLTGLCVLVPGILVGVLYSFDSQYYAILVSLVSFYSLGLFVGRYS